MIGGIPWTPGQIRAIDRDRAGGGLGLVGWARRLLGKSSAQTDEDLPDDQRGDSTKSDRS
jgi:hypothetical protein